MTRILNQRLEIDELPADAGRCLVRVAYEVEVAAGDPAAERAVDERIVLRAVDEHDAAVRPTPEPVVETNDTFTAAVGRTMRRVERPVRRIDLDVEQDWWSSGSGGETIPIAEWPDHLAADITLAIDDRSIAHVTTPTVTGSWGASAAGDSG